MGWTGNASKSLKAATEVEDPSAPVHGHQCDLESDVTDLLVALGQAAAATEKPLALMIDELQYLPARHLAALIRGVHAVAQEALPVVLFGAGLPQLFSQVGDAKSYAERLFRFTEIDRLSHSELFEAIRDPVTHERAKAIFTSCRNGGTARGIWPRHVPLASRWHAKPPRSHFANWITGSSAFDSIE